MLIKSCFGKTLVAMTTQKTFSGFVHHSKSCCKIICNAHVQEQFQLHSWGKMSVFYGNSFSSRRLEDAASKRQRRHQPYSAEKTNAIRPYQPRETLFDRESVCSSIANNYDSCSDSSPEISDSIPLQDHSVISTPTDRCNISSTSYSGSHTENTPTGWSFTGIP